MGNEGEVLDLMAHRLRLALTGLLVITVVIGAARVIWANLDRDDDGLADSCERAGLRSAGVVWNTDPGEVDTDGDGINDGDEVAPDASPAGVHDLVGLFRSCHGQIYSALSNPTVPDSDEDGLDDARELSEGSSAFAADSDDDGLSDSAEREWGADPNAVDTDGDGIRDGDDTAAGLTPVVVDDPIDDAAWEDEFNQGLLYGDIKEMDSVPQLLGSMVGGSSSVVPVIGWIPGTAADLRDVVANSIDGDWSSAATSGAGVLPYVGDSARLSKQLTTFVAKNPDKVRSVVKALAAQEKLPVSVRVQLLRVTDGTPIDQLHKSGVSDEDIVRLAERGTRLAVLVMLLDKARTVLHDLPEGDEGFATSLDDAERMLREYAEEADDTADVASGPVYISDFPAADFTGGRLIDACTKCLPHLESGTSSLRVARVGSQTYSQTLQSQIDKDAYLRKQGYAVEWHFFAGPTGSDVDPLVVEALAEAGIPHVVHLPG
jgi:hypothetical protein